MRAGFLVIAALFLAACSVAPAAAPVAAVSVPDGRPELFDATPDGGRVANADGIYADEAAEIAAAHCNATDRDVRITGITLERHALIFTCVAA